MVMKSLIDVGPHDIVGVDPYKLRQYIEDWRATGRWPVERVRGEILYPGRTWFNESP